MKTSLLILLLLPLGLLAQNRYDVVINEIMADPNPPVGLPENEWIELTNKASSPIDLQGWRIGDENGISGPMPAFTLHPDSFVIVCGNSALTPMRQFGATIAVSSFPSLGNDNDQLFVRSSGGYTVHAINYYSFWYANSLKKEGGWSMEMIDSHNPCGGSNNWKASNGVTGGTPGKKNSVQMNNADKTPPQLINAFTTDSATIILIFDEPVDSLAGSLASNYSIDGNLPIQAAMVLGPLFNQVQIRTGGALKVDFVYTIRAANVVDCAGNNIGSKNEIRIGLPSEPVPGEWVINEILFNPRPNAYDYVEFYNNSNRIFDAARLYIANRNSSGTIGSTRVLSELPFYVFPGDYLVATEDGPGLSIHYLVRDQENALTLSSLPSFPDEAGVVVALNGRGEVVDEVNYHHDWHFRLITNEEGISLEKIDPSSPSETRHSWHSAASTAGFGTPTYKNSQFMQTGMNSANITVLPKVFSPDNDGRDDVAQVQYQVEEHGYLANITIFDGAGRPVRRLVNNGLMGVRGGWTWDGLDDQGLKLPVGIYVLFVEVFNLRGKKELYKNAIVLGKPLK